MRWMAIAVIFSFLAAGPAGAATSIADAEQLVKETTETVLKRLEGERAALREDKTRLYALIEGVVLPHFDFEAMSRIVLTRYWRQASTDQRRRFIEQFRDLLVRTYGTALLEYTGQKIRYKPVHAAEDADRVKVPTEVGGDGPPIPIIYSLYRKDGEWQVYDISVDGISLLLNYRNEYTREVRRNGLDALIEKMARHNQGAA